MKLARSISIEFAGMPKSGKTTVMDVISHYLRREGLPVAEFHGGGRYAPLGKSDLGRLNLYLACDAVRYCLSTHAEGSAPRIHLLDRGLVDRMLFTRALLSMGKVSPAHAESIGRLVEIPDLRDEIDLCFVFTTSPRASLAREAVNKLTSHQGRVMNDHFLVGLRNTALRFVSDHERTVCAQRLVAVDTEASDGRVAETALQVFTQISAVLLEQGVRLPPPGNDQSGS
ncbi:hypothetical protein OG875_25640 [Streptomyces sp. NBC_01498]|uniref:hypothetical protein n=1 Tax=Streptomyces sp. NBC_01498 TaxID=2975870 RepID=UPI002E7AD2A7|nr:hypothetical protein [Streptomyces sp. NBC_01498]WTL27654.1 hypothetical protein OG875_25640 [Streptomyces sp. NBC_01498]